MMKEKDLRGCSFGIDNGKGTVFKAVGLQPYTDGDVASKYPEMEKVKHGSLVAVPIGEILAPGILLAEKFVYLTRIRIDGKDFYGPVEIADALEVNEPFVPLDLKKV